MMLRYFEVKNSDLPNKQSAKKWKATTSNLAKAKKLSETNIVTIQLEGEKQSFILTKKNFKTGSKGYHAHGKMVAGGKNYQVNVLCVEIGSKPKEKEK